MSSSCLGGGTGDRLVRFLLRCIVCLGVLYAAILRHDGYLVDPARLAMAAWTAPRQAGETIAASAAPQITARLEVFCRQDPAACLSDAMALARPLGVAPAAQIAPTPNAPV